MPKYIDLSHPITHQMPVFPADPAVGVLLHTIHFPKGILNQAKKNRKLACRE
jgi:kynurenine formamidase